MPAMLPEPLPPSTCDASGKPLFDPTEPGPRRSSLGFPVTSLVPQETKEHYRDKLLVHDDKETQASSIVFRHRMYQWHRRRVLSAFDTLNIPESVKYAYLHCGSAAFVMQHRDDPERYSLRCTTCHHRWCQSCCRSRSSVIRRNIEPLIAGKVVRFITLTRKNDQQPLSEQLDHLYASFKRLRKTVLWKKAVHAGIAFCEVKRSENTGLWHPHLHLIVTGKYLPQQQLSRAWLAATSTSHVVDIRLVRDPAQVARYITKYCMKPTDNQVYRCPEALTEAIRALSRRRLCMTFGAWRGKPLLKNETLDEWEPLMPWSDLIAECRFGNPNAVAIYNQLASSPYTCEDTQKTLPFPDG